MCLSFHQLGRRIISIIVSFSFLYTQIAWAAGYELLKYSLEDIPHKGFRPPEEAYQVEARKRYLVRKQQEIDQADIHARPPDSPDHRYSR